MNTNFQTVLTFLEDNNAPQNVIDALGALAPTTMGEELNENGHHKDCQCDLCVELFGPPA